MLPCTTPLGTVTSCPQDSAQGTVPADRAVSDETGNDCGGGGGRGGDDEVNSVSLLQEYIQGCSAFAPQRKILTWNFDEQLENETKLQFRANVVCHIGDVPHHFVGGWQTSKKKAQKDAADRVRCFLGRRYESPPAPHDTLSLPNIHGRMAAPRSQAQASAKQQLYPVSAVTVDDAPSQLISELENICGGGGGLGSDGPVEWSLEEDQTSDSILYRATLTVSTHSVPFKFCGSWCATAFEARKDTAERVLWYFGKGFESFVAPRGSAKPNSANRMLPPARLPTASSQGHSVVGGGGGGGGGNSAATADGESILAVSSGNDHEQLVKDKTVAMYVQNVLQKQFSKDTPPGQRVWVWDYEPDPSDHQVFRATVKVPAWGRQFVGEWSRGKKLAQRSACLIVRDHLDDLRPV
eukprot:TRINITY_DN68868_c0_g1_i1.p1 TRINITY_DN68868_c0_g1~~TRINITY_DN68868_c0_g1_i1.p1  ORF type:complete len:436 (-),score=73.61 TRINITY_DN68868_c0_g1_i1:111-1337(-)